MGPIAIESDMNELLIPSLTEIVAALKAREFSAIELMQATLDRVAATHSELNALIYPRGADQCLADATLADERIASGSARPLEGVPLAVKDLEDAAGLVTSHGSLLYKDNLVERDSPNVARLKAAGAIVIGKTNAPEFGAPAFTKNPLYGATRSPWNLDFTPGGSSGGSSALLAGCCVPLVTASDGGGSIRIPASFVGAFGLKPSYGRVPRNAIDAWEFGDTSHWGPLTKTVADGALYMDQVVGPSPNDANSLPHPGYSYVEKLKESLPKLKVAFSPDLGYGVVQSDIAASVKQAVEVFAAMGHEVEQIQGGPPDAGRTWSRTGSFFSAARLSHVIGTEQEQLIGRGFLHGIKQGYKMTPDYWRQAAEDRQAVANWVCSVFEEYDLLLTPTVPTDPFPPGGPYYMETEGKPQPPSNIGTFTIPFNLSWHPAGTVRCGMSERGFPIGLQIIAPRHRDDLVLQAAHAYEQANPWHPVWPHERIGITG